MKDFTHDVLGKMIWIPPPKGWYLMSDFQREEYSPETCYFVKLSKGFWIQEKHYSDDGKTPKVQTSWYEAVSLAQRVAVNNPPKYHHFYACGGNRKDRPSANYRVDAVEDDYTPLLGFRLVIEAT